MSKYIDTINNLIPKETCHKCGKRSWNFTTEKCTWSCICCGNLIYFSFGVLEQQIDKVMASSARSSEFVYSEEGDYIKPKKDETLKKLRFDGLLP
jgi:hypothetical protein